MGRRPRLRAAARAPWGPVFPLAPRSSLTEVPAPLVRGSGARGMVPRGYRSASGPLPGMRPTCGEVPLARAPRRGRCGRTSGEHLVQLVDVDRHRGERAEFGPVEVPEEIEVLRDSPEGEPLNPQLELVVDGTYRGEARRMGGGGHSGHPQGRIEYGREQPRGLNPPNPPAPIPFPRCGPVDPLSLGPMGLRFARSPSAHGPGGTSLAELRPGADPLQPGRSVRRRARSAREPADLDGRGARSACTRRGSIPPAGTCGAPCSTHGGSGPSDRPRRSEPRIRYPDGRRSLVRPRSADPPPGGRGVPGDTPKPAAGRSVFSRPPPTNRTPALLTRGRCAERDADGEASAPVAGDPGPFLLGRWA